MKELLNKLTNKDVDELFKAGTIMVFKCAPTSTYPITFVSDNVKKILGYPTDYFYDNENAWSENIHPEDRNEVSDKFSYILENGGSVINEYRFKRKDGEQIWLRDEIKMQVDDNGNSLAIVGTSFEITDRKISELQVHRDKEAELRNRLSYQHVLAKCSNLLVESGSENILQEVVEMLQEVTGSDRVYVFFNSTNKEGELFLSQKYEACDEGVEPQIDNPELQNLPYSNFPYFYETLKGNNIINEPVSNLPSPEKDLMESQDIEAVLMFPIFVGDDWYGMLGFDSVGSARDWEDYELITLKTTVDLIGTFLKRLSVKELLIQQKNFTQQLLDNLPSIVVVVDKKMNLLLWNKTGERLTGYSSEELQTMTAFDFVSKDDRSKLTDAVKQINSNNSYGQEIYLKHKQGMKSPYFWRAAPIEMEGQEVFLIIGMNISKQKEMEKALQQEKRFANAIIDGLPGIFFMVDEDLNYVRVNKNLVDDLGYSEDELLGMNPLDNYQEGDREQVLAKINELMKKGKASIESNPVTKEGKILSRNLNAVLFERDGKKFIIGTGQDISDLKKREKELRATLHEKEILLQEIHHRVKNNLAVISGLLELQVNEYPDSKFQKLTRESQMRIQTMAMIHEKLYQSQNLTRISVVEYIHQLLEHIKNSISYGESEITIETDIAEVELNINLAIPFALALNEIVTNALEHAFVNRKEGHIKIKFEDLGDQIHTTISDNGVGLPKGGKYGEESSLGVTLIRALFTQIEANWNVSVDNGFTYDITFPKWLEKGSSSAL